MTTDAQRLTLPGEQARGLSELAVTHDSQVTSTLGIQIEQATS